MKTSIIAVNEKSSLKGKELIVNYRSDERFIIKEEVLGGSVIVLANDGIEYCFNLSDDVVVVTGKKQI